MPTPKDQQHNAGDDYADIQAQHPPPEAPPPEAPPPEAHDSSSEATEGVFRVRDEGSANWVVRKIIAARTHAKRAKDWAQQEVRRAEREEAFFLWRFGRDLEAWVQRRLRETGTRRKSVGLPAGTVGYRSQPSKLVVDDEQAAMAWARDHCPDAVVVREQLVKSKLDAHLDTTGELPPGTRMEPETDHFYVK